jgi:hypothetical protein
MRSHLSRAELADLAATIVRYTDVLGERAALVELISATRRTERNVHRKRSRLRLLALKLRRERRELEIYQRQVAGAAGRSRQIPQTLSRMDPESTGRTRLHQAG